MDELKHVDEFEDYPNDYDRISVELEDRRGKKFEGLAYIMNKTDEFAYPCTTYLPGIALTMAAYHYLHDEEFDYSNFEIEVFDARTGTQHDTHRQRLSIVDYPDIVRSKLERIVV